MIKYGLDWTNKTWINKLWIDETWINKTCIYDQIRKGLFFLGFIGIEYDKNDLGTDVPVQQLLLSVTQHFRSEMKLNEASCILSYFFFKRVVSFCQQ